MPGRVIRNDCLVLERQSADFTARVFRHPGNFSMRAHAHDQPGISVVLGGAVVEEADHAAVTAKAGWAVVKPAGTVHTNRFGPMGATVLALVPRSQPECALPSRWTWVDRPSVLQAALRLICSTSAANADPDADTFTELLASLSTERAAGADIGWLRKLKRRLDDRTEAPASVASLAAEADVHPVYLARRFRARYGISIRQYRKIVQVRQALELIVGSRRSLSEIAHSCGFADHSHMCRSFQLVARANPRSFRFS